MVPPPPAESYPVQECTLLNAGAGFTELNDAFVVKNSYPTDRREISCLVPTRKLLLSPTSASECFGGVYYCTQWTDIPDYYTGNPVDYPRGTLYVKQAYNASSQAMLVQTFVSDYDNVIWKRQSYAFSLGSVPSYWNTWGAHDRLVAKLINESVNNLLSPGIYTSSGLGFKDLPVEASSDFNCILHVYGSSYTIRSDGSPQVGTVQKLYVTGRNYFEIWARGSSTYGWESWHKLYPASAV